MPTSDEFVRPPAIEAGNRPDRIHVIASSGPVNGARLKRGLAHVRRRFGEPVLAANLEVRNGYFAGDDEARLEALRGALSSQAALLWCARGGYGATRLLDRLDPTRLRASPKLLLGFSDVTALLCWALERAGICSIHGPVLGQLDEIQHEDRARLWTMLEGELPPPLVAEGDDATCVNGGRVEGRLIVGNLEIFRSLIGTGSLPKLDGAILAIEEVGERPYRIDRALTQLLASGSLRGVRGVAVGRLHACAEPEGGGSRGWSAREAVLDRLERLGVPVVMGLPFGHAPDHNAALPFGSMCRLDAEQGSLEMLEPVCAS